MTFVNFSGRAIFDIPSARRILIAARVSVAVTVGTWIAFGPFPSFYPEEEQLLYAPHSLLAFVPSLGALMFGVVKVVVVVGCVGMMFERTALASTRLTAAFFALLNGYVAGFSEQWNYNTHLNTFLVALCFAPSYASDNAPIFDASRSAIVFFMRFQVSVIYAQAALAKLVHGGWEWPYMAPYIHLVLLSDQGYWMHNFPKLVASFGVIVILAELILPVMFLLGRTRVWAVAIATSLHLAFYVTLNISFWHLWVLFPALFLVDKRQCNQARRSGSAN